MEDVCWELMLDGIVQLISMLRLLFNNVFNADADADAELIDNGTITVDILDLVSLAKANAASLFTFEILSVLF